ncbi:MAG: FlgD immunoglobulin-like domain containing protein, partial [Armatimonadota bacterium]
DSTTDGVDHFYIVRTLEDDQQTDSDTVGPVQSVDNRASTTVDFPAGLSFVGFSVQPLNQDPAALFGVPPQNLDWARYDPGADVYRLLADSPTDPFLQIQLGIGYWLRLAAPATVYPDGFQASPGPFLTSLTPGWNQAANPFDGTADFGGVRVLSGGEELTLAEAAVLGLVNPSGWLYESQSSQYVMLNELLGETDIPAGAAFWMLAFDDVGLATPQPAGGTLGRGPQPEAGEDDWHARLVARSGALADAHNFFGRHSGAPAAVRVVDPPPRPGPDVSLYFLGHDGSRLASAFVSDGQDEMTWPFVVECTVPGAEVQVACPDLSAVPRRYRVLLTDLDSGRRQLLRARRAYTYTAGSGPSRRRFRLTLSCATGDALTITGLAALPARGPGAEITFGLSRTAVVDVDVVNVAGRRVRLVRDGALHQAGRAAITWDGRTNAGTRAPAGVYLVRVRAAAADGQSAAAVARVHVER